jgi:DNA-binding beta-propeller fold protein YncE
LIERGCPFITPARGSALSRCIPALFAALSSLIAVPVALAQIAVSTHDSKTVLDNGVIKTVQNPPPDTVAIIDFSGKAPRVTAQIDAPVSLFGPPFSVAVAPDESYALVTSGAKINPADPTKTMADNRMSVIDLKASPPRIIATVETGSAPWGVSINPQGTLALVANHNEGSVSVFTISGKQLQAAGKIKLGGETSGPSHVAISPDGRTALVTRDGDNRISVLSIEGNDVQYTKRDINAGLRPYGVVICNPGDIGVAANVGLGQGDEDTVSVIDLTVKPPRVVDTVSVGQTPEGLACSPDGKLLAVGAMSGSNKAKDSPFYRAHGRVVLFHVKGRTISRFAEADVGNWAQGLSFSPDGRKLIVQNTVQKELQVFDVTAEGLRDTGQRIAVNGGAAIRIAEPGRH